MNVEVRPATKAEQMYCYTQSDQIMGQTGCIGHLRADMGDSGNQFFHDWTSHCERLQTPEFDDEFNQVINQLRRWRFPEKQSSSIGILLSAGGQRD